MIAFGLGAKVAAGLSVLMIAAGAGFYFYYNHTQARLTALAEQISSYRDANEALQRTITRREEELARQIRSLDQLGREVNQIRKEAGELAELLARHDLKYLASQRPGLIENRVNAGTKQVFQELRDISDPERYSTPGGDNER